MVGLVKKGPAHKEPKIRRNAAWNEWHSQYQKSLPPPVIAFCDASYRELESGNQAVGANIICDFSHHYQMALLHTMTSKITTSINAELLSIILAMEHVPRKRLKACFSDSESAVEILNGMQKYHDMPVMRGIPYRRTEEALARQPGISFEWKERGSDEIRLADRFASYSRRGKITKITDLSREIFSTYFIEPVDRFTNRIVPMPAGNF